MSPEPDVTAVRFYFSFRSPYAWLAAERIEAELGDLDVSVERIPLYPTPELFPNDPVSMPRKVAYLLQDVPRVARAFGLTVRFPSVVDPDWSLSHAAYLGADAQGAGHAFMLEAFRKRWVEGLDLGDDDVIADAGERAGLDRRTILGAAHSEEYRRRAAGGFEAGIERDGIFGVPTFVHAGKLYWGQDRMPFLREAVIRKSARAS